MLLIKNGEIYITICEEKRLPRRFAPCNDKSHLVCHRTLTGTTYYSPYGKRN